MSRYPYYDVDDPWAEDDSDYDYDDGFPMSVEYDGLWGGSDWQDELTAQQEAEYERDFFGDDY